MFVVALLILLKADKTHRYTNYVVFLISSIITIGLLSIHLVHLVLLNSCISTFVK